MTSTAAENTQASETEDAAGAERKIIGFFCRECAYAAADATGNARVSLPTTIRSVLVPCTGRVSPLHLLSALADGADGVYVAGCLVGQCHYREATCMRSTGSSSRRRFYSRWASSPSGCRCSR